MLVQSEPRAFAGRWLLVFALTSIWSAAPAQEPQICDPEVLRLSGGGNPYQLRGDRCEGTYVKEVASDIFLASVYQSFADFDPKSTTPLTVEWPALGVGDIHLQADGIRLGLYYRMNTTRPSGSRSYTWPLDVIAAQEIQRWDVGLVGWFQHVVEDESSKVYLPLRISQQQPADSCASTKVVIWPGSEPDSVYVSVRRLRENGSLGDFVVQRQELGDGYYPAEVPITIALPSLDEPGVYQVDLDAPLRTGGRWPGTYLIYQAGNPAGCKES